MNKADLAAQKIINQVNSEKSKHENGALDLGSLKRLNKSLKRVTTQIDIISDYKE